MPRRAPTTSLRTGLLVALCLHGTPAVGQPLTLEIVRSAADFDQRTKEPIVSIVLSKESGVALGKLTGERVGQTMDVRLNGELVARPVIREPLVGGSFQISGQFSVDQTADLASRLPAGSKIEVEVAAR